VEFFNVAFKPKVAPRELALPRGPWRYNVVYLINHLAHNSMATQMAAVHRIIQHSVFILILLWLWALRARAVLKFNIVAL
jgi:hypothetical protein